MRAEVWSLEGTVATVCRHLRVSLRTSGASDVCGMNSAYWDGRVNDRKRTGRAGLKLTRETTSSS